MEAKNSFLLESLATCHNADSKLVMYFMVNATCVNYLDSLDNLTDSLKSQILLNRITYKQTLPISFISFKLYSELLKVPKTLNNNVHQFQHKKGNFLLARMAY